MSEVAGRMSIQEGAKYLERPQMGRGILLGGVPGVAPAHITILGGGVVGANAAKIAAGFQADVAILDIDIPTKNGSRPHTAPSAAQPKKTQLLICVTSTSTGIAILDRPVTLSPQGTPLSSVRLMVPKPLNWSTLLT